MYPYTSPNVYSPCLHHPGLTILEEFLLITIYRHQPEHAYSTVDHVFQLFVHLAIYVAIPCIWFADTEPRAAHTQSSWAIGRPI